MAEKVTVIKIPTSDQKLIGFAINNVWTKYIFVDGLLKYYWIDKSAEPLFWYPQYLVFSHSEVCPMVRIMEKGSCLWLLS